MEGDGNSMVKYRGKVMMKRYSKRHLRRLKKREIDKVRNGELLKVENVSTENEPECFYNRAVVTVNPQEQINLQNCNVQSTVHVTENYCSPSYHIERTQHEETMKTKLASWMLQFKISQNASNALLSILQEAGLTYVPKDSRTLLKTSELLLIYDMLPGRYHHFGIEVGIKHIFRSNNIMNYSCDIINIEINVDGLPLTKSSNSCFWPILGFIDDVTLVKNLPFEIGIYHGYKKPESPDVFLKYFMQEMKKLEKDGFVFNDKTIKIKITKILCDAPAKSFLLGVKGHNSYFGCTKCTTEGEFIRNRMTFPDLNAELRTHEKLVKGDYEDYIVKASPLIELDIDLIKQVPLDYLHLCCLGVMKRLLTLWLKGPRDVRIADENVKKINEMLQKFRSVWPQEFCRLPRPLHDVDRWKATEFRQFIFYTGPIVLKNNLHPPLYKHFMAFHIAMRILACEDLCRKYNNYTKELLIYVTEMFGELYGPEQLTHNVHNLVHLPEDVCLHGCLDNFSCFKYENYMHILKMKLKSSNRPLEQIIKRINEYRTHGLTDCVEAKTQSEGKIHNTGTISYVSYKWIIYKNWKIDTTVKNSNFLLNDGRYVKVKKIFSYINDEERKYVICQYLKVNAFYSNPCSSTMLYCGQIDVGTSDDSLIVVPVYELKYKCICYEDIIISMMHAN